MLAGVSFLWSYFNRKEVGKEKVPAHWGGKGASKNSPKLEDDCVFIAGGILRRNQSVSTTGSLLRVHWNKGDEQQRKERHVTRKRRNEEEADEEEKS